MPWPAVFAGDHWQLTAPAAHLVAGDCWLRPWQSPDAAALAAAWADPEIIRWNAVPAEPSLARAQAWITGWQSRLAAGVALDLAVVVADDVVGEVGISGVNSARRAGQIGYWIGEGSRGRGLAVDATRALADWALSDGGFHLLVAQCHPDNIASQRTAERAGFVHQASAADETELWARRA